MRGVKVNISIKQRMILSKGTNFSLRGSPRPRPPGLVFEGSPFGSFSVGLRSLLVPGYVASLRPGTSSLVAGLSWTQREYCRTQKTRSLVVPGSVASLRPLTPRWPRATTYPHPNSVGPSQASATIGHREPASQNEKHVVGA